MRDWSPFRLAAPGEHGPSPRAMNSREGIGDRLRAAAFAEIQAREAFLWAAEKFADAPLALRRGWRALAMAEERHLGWLLRRMEELGVAVDERPVSDALWHSLMECRNAKEFAWYIANAEERGRLAGVRFQKGMATVDPVTAEIFGRIAEEEVEHVALAYRYYPQGSDRPLEAHA
jgi:uncharacterized ferritin-like protein (DUF455 family)